MKTCLLILFSVVLSYTNAALEPATKPRIRYGLTKKLLQEVPQNVSEATAMSWILTPPPDNAFSLLQLYCYPDFKVCGWYCPQIQDNVCGVQIGYPIDDISDAAFDFPTQGFTKWTVSANQTQRSFWATSQYYISPDDLNSPDTISPTSTGVLVQGQVWVQGFNSNLMNISTDLDEVVAGGYTKEGCQDGKGQHYLYQLSDSGPPCAADTLLHWFPIFSDGQLTATGLFLLAKVAKDPGQREWFERPPGIGLRGLIPNAPQCLYQLADSPGVVSTHIYYVQKPNSIPCPPLNTLTTFVNIIGGLLGF